MEKLIIIPSRAAPGATVAGWIEDLVGEEWASDIVIVDSAEVIRGLGQVATSSVTDDRRRRWTGFVARPRPHTKYTAYAIVGGEWIGCRLSGGRPPHPG